MEGAVEKQSTHVVSQIGLDESELYENVESVTSGVVRIAELWCCSVLRSITRNVMFAF